MGDEWRNVSVEERLEYSLVKVIKFNMSAGLLSVYLCSHSIHVYNSHILITYMRYPVCMICSVSVVHFMMSTDAVYVHNTFHRVLTNTL